MDWLFKVSSPFKQFYLALTVVLLAFISACGGGGFEESANPTDPTDPNSTAEININLTLVSANDDTPVQSITSSQPGRIIATVTGITTPVIVTFSSTIGSIPIPTAITDDNNQASVDIVAGNSLGAGTISARVETGEVGKLVFSIGATNLTMGSFANAEFQEKVAAIGTPQISAGGTTTVTVAIVDGNGDIFNEPVEVNFTSACASTTPAAASISSPITTVNGVASTTYLAQGCVGDDTISATANAGSISLSASGKVNILSADVGSIEFVSATPENIVIQGAGGIGGSESSTVVFRVKDTNGQPLNGEVVNFSLNTSAGGISIDPLTATTNLDGLVQTVVNSGTVGASVRVTAAIEGSDPEIVTQSSNLVVSTGIPDQDSFTLAASQYNPEGWDIAGAPVQITAFLADGFNNPVPDGTVVYFSTEGGRIDDSCTTEDGQCVVTWNSQNPRPIGATHGEAGNGPSTYNWIKFSDGTANPDSLGQPYGGRVTIIGTAIGEESFPDANGNGRFDESEMENFLYEKDVGGRPYDLDEAYRDHNEDGFFNPWQTDPDEQDGGEIEILVDFDGDNSWTEKDEKYNGVLCSIPAHLGCSSQKSVHVRAQLVLVMSGSTPFIRTTRTGDSIEPNNPNDNTMYLATESQATGSVVISDLHNQPMPAGTVISFEATIGSLVGTTSFEVPSTNKNGGHGFGFTVKAGNETGSGEIIVTITTPSGYKTVTSVAFVSVQ
ncbi:hypothetical protein [Aliikangiella maris]|uniref:Big-1 domain-containing protein n=2 Tax=Aliikangiella maris TaxID=3162458 RepID=A0ABV3MSE0_9GAMM